MTMEEAQTAPAVVIGTFLIIAIQLPFFFYFGEMNPNKCAFGVSVGQFLSFMVHERGIEVCQKSMKAIDEAAPLTNKTEFQSLIGKINFIQRFISNLSVINFTFVFFIEVKS